MDKDAQKYGSEKSAEIFTTLVAITKTVQVETTAYCALGEQNSAKLCLQQFEKFIVDNKLNEKNTLLLFNSFAPNTEDIPKIIESFMQIQEKIMALPQNIERTEFLEEPKK